MRLMILTPLFWRGSCYPFKNGDKVGGIRDAAEEGSLCYGFYAVINKEPLGLLNSRLGDDDTATLAGLGFYLAVQMCSCHAEGGGYLLKVYIAARHSALNLLLECIKKPIGIGKSILLIF